MDWYQVLAIAGSTIGACWYMHRETTIEMKNFYEQMRDFHGRLCTLEERHLQLMQRFLEEKHPKR